MVWQICKLQIKVNLSQPNVSAILQTLQPHDSAGIGELALDPTLFGSSTTLLNADHHEVYFSGMPQWNAKVCIICPWLLDIILEVQTVTTRLCVCRSSVGMAMNLNVPRKDIIGLMDAQMIQ
jgi:hypothetical protein